MTLREIRTMLSEAYAATAFCPKTNETYYPAQWTMGDGAGDASTTCHYDKRLQRAAEHVADELGVGSPGFADDCTRLRDAADLIATAVREQAKSDATIDAELDTAL